jgi:hypothetical protein
MRVPLTLFSALVAGLLVSAAAPTPPRLPIAVVTLALDDTRHGQSRYVDQLVARAGESSAWFDYQPSQLDHEALIRCMDASLDGAEVCVRYIMAGQDMKSVRPVHVVVLVGPAGPGGDLTTVRCIGIGGTPKREETQTITVDPGSMMYASATRSNEDLNALAGCMTAAGSESGW